MHIKRVDILIFLLAVLIVVISNLIILKPVFNVGFTTDEWVQLVFYKVYKFRPLDLWNIRGLYTTTFAYFIGILVDLFGLNIQAIQTANVVLKIIAALSVFPLVLYAFKNKLLAYLTTILYAINHTVAKSLEFPIKGGDYLATIFMSLFLIAYIHAIKKSMVSIRWFFLLSILFVLTIMGSPIRMYPLAAFIVFVEIFIFIRKPAFYTVKSTLLRIMSVYLFPLIVYLYKPAAISAFLVGLPFLYGRVQSENWSIFTTPLQGLGYSILTDSQFGWVFRSYLSFRSLNDFLFVAIRIIILSLVFIVPTLNFFSKKGSKKQVSSILITIIIAAGIYILGALYGKINFYLGLPLNYLSFFSAALGTFILIVGVIFYKQWERSQLKNSVLLASFVGSFFAFIFTILTWMFAGTLGSFGSQQYYLVIASLGTSLFVASILTLIYKEFKKVIILPQLFLIGAVVLFFKISLVDNQIYFSSINQYRKGFFEQTIIQKAVKEKIKIEKNHEPILVYLDTSQDIDNQGFYEQAILTNFGWFMPIQDGRIIDGCLGLLYNTTPLKTIVRFEKEKTFLVNNGVCIEDGTINYQYIISYEPKNFYAYKLKGYELTDIRSEVLNKLEIYEN